MSSPFSLETKRGTEETIEALHRTAVWASRIDTTNDATEIDTSFVQELNEEEERLKRKYKIKNTERTTDNFVFNHCETVKQILCGDLDEKVSGLEEFRSHLSDEFGYVSPPSLTKEQLLWLLSRQVLTHRGRIDEYSNGEMDDIDLENQGERPDLWKNEEYPIYS